MKGFFLISSLALFSGILFGTSREEKKTDSTRLFGMKFCRLVDVSSTLLDFVTVGIGEGEGEGAGEGEAYK